jgi:hypothetical protein
MNLFVVRSARAARFKRCRCGPQACSPRQPPRTNTGGELACLCRSRPRRAACIVAAAKSSWPCVVMTGLTVEREKNMRTRPPVLHYMGESTPTLFLFRTGRKLADGSSSPATLPCIFFFRPLFRSSEHPGPLPRTGSFTIAAHPNEVYGEAAAMCWSRCRRKVSGVGPGPLPGALR